MMHTLTDDELLREAFAKNLDLDAMTRELMTRLEQRNQDLAHAQLEDE